MKNAKSAVCDMLLLAGLALITAGAGMAHIAAGLITGGASLVILGWLISNAGGDDDAV